VRVPDDANHIVGSGPFREMRLESIPQPFDRGFAFERRQAGTEHKVDCIDKLIGERPDGEERLDGKLLEHSVALALSSAHEHDHLVTQFETVGFKLDTSRSYVE
jgi:hypothetical protein